MILTMLDAAGSRPEASEQLALIEWVARQLARDDG